MNDEQTDAAVLELRDELRAVDPAAFDEVDGWWLAVFEQMEIGLL